MFPTKKTAFVLFLITVSFHRAFSVDLPDFRISEVSEFNYRNHKQSKILVMDYASFIIENPEVWENQDKQKQVVQVDIVFTKYPFHKNDWITHYDSLLMNRIRAIRELEPGVQDKSVKWNLILQTNCRNEEEAKNLFHGAVIWYKEVGHVVSVASKTVKMKPVKASENIKELVSGRYEFPDSTVFKVLGRNEEWENMLIVNDWTASMYQYGAQAVLWHKQQLRKDKVSSFVFFNDGDNRKKIARTKGVYSSDSKNPDQLVKLMEKVQKNGNGGDAPEKYIEALITATDKVKSYNEVILIADNKSSVKDISRLKEFSIPVRVIVCGVKKGETIKHDYLQLASATKGSVHTIEGDIFDVAEIKEGERIEILGVEYQRTRGRIVKYRPCTVKARNL